jgi:hypothetical protein
MQNVEEIVWKISVTYNGLYIPTRFPEEIRYFIKSKQWIRSMRVKGKGKAISVTDREGPQGCETSRLPHFLDNRLTNGGEFVSLTRRPSFTPQEDSWYSFPLEAESTPGP